jgi:hypothetical protein
LNELVACVFGRLNAVTVMSWDAMKDPVAGFKMAEGAFHFFPKFFLLNF